MGIDLRLRRRSSRDLTEDFAASKAVLIVLICLSIKLWIWGNGGMK